MTCLVPPFVKPNSLSLWTLLHAQQNCGRAQTLQFSFLSGFESSSLLSTHAARSFCFYNFRLQQRKDVLLGGCTRSSVLQPAAIRKTICVHFVNILLHKQKSPDGSGFAPLPGAHIQYLAASKDARLDQVLKPSAWLHYRYVHAPTCGWSLKATKLARNMCVCVCACLHWKQTGPAPVYVERQPRLSRRLARSQGHVQNRLSCLRTGVLFPSRPKGQLRDLFLICCVRRVVVARVNRCDIDLLFLKIVSYPPFIGGSLAEI